MKKNWIFTFVLGLTSWAASAQNVSISTDNTDPDPSAMLDVKSTDRGVLIPRMTQAQRDAIVSPATGLMIYQTDATAGFYYYNGTAWASVAPAGADNLGNHTATANLNMSGFNITNGGAFNTTGLTATAAVLSGNTYPTVMGSNGQVLTTNGAGTLTWTTISGADNLGNHTATANLNMSGFNITNGGAFNTTGLTATAAVLGGNTYPTVMGSNGQVLTTNGAGVLSWVTPSGGADNLGNHTATTNIQLSGNRLTNNGTGGISIDNSGNATVNGTLQTGQDGTNGELRLYSEQGATDYTTTILPNPASTQNNTFTLPADDGTNGQVLTTDGSGNFSWSSAGGIQHVFQASATLVQNFNTGVSVTDGTGTMRYDNEIVGPTIGTWTNDSVYTVASTGAGVYLITAHVVASKVGGIASSLSPYIQVNAAGSGALKQRVYGACFSSSNGFPTNSGSRGEVTGIVILAAGDTVRIKVSNGSVSTIGVVFVGADTPSRINIVKLL